jgi:hypothetical protein
MNLYIYKFDTISLPFLDDFSTDKFNPVSQVGDPNVAEDTYYRIFISGLPDYSGMRYVQSPTYYIEITRDAEGNLTKDSTENPEISLEIFDISTYPPTSSLVSAWIDTTYIDSMWNSTSPDIKFALKPDFIQDSLLVYTVSPLPNSADYVWQDRFVYRSTTRGINPPTVGVATFDATDDFGIPYDILNVARQGLADELTSKAIALSGFAPSDSVYLSFFYQYKGNGDSPEPEDELELEFWSPILQTWTKVWSANSGSSTQFNQVMIALKDNNYFFNGFQFRFRNYATLSGALDHWHIDYVYMNQNRAFNDFNQPDVAHRYGLSSLLANNYTSMPWEHYITSPSDFMGNSLDVKHFNTNNAVESYEDNTVEVLYQGVLKHTMNGPAIVPDFFSQTQITHNYQPKTQGVVFDPTVDPYLAHFEVKSHFKHTGDFNPNNDTVSYYQRFLNYYSYDDNSAEYAYYVLGNNVQIAQKITSAVSDTLRAIQIEFEPVAHNSQNEPFYLTVWKADGPSGAPGTLLHQNNALSRPKYIGFENDGFVEYVLEKELILPAGSFYIGIQQTSNQRINIGFDISKDNSERIYYNIDGDWFNTSLSGTLMMRAVFKTAGDFLMVSTKEVATLKEQEKKVDVYPNPFNQMLFVGDGSEEYAYQVLDLSGKIVLNGSTYNAIDMSSISQGMYVLRLIDSHQNTTIKKVIKQE